jgi:hypothetical protein
VDTTTLDFIGSLAIAAATLVLAVVTGLFAHSYRRKMAIELAESRRIAYSRLYELTGLAAHTRLDLEGTEGALSPEDRESLYGELTTWYYRDGNGMLLNTETRNVYLKAKRNLLCDPRRVKPDGLLDLISEDLSRDRASPLDNDTLRGIMSIRQLSLLRTQLKSDLAILGDAYTGQLSRHERVFLTDCRISLNKPPWRSATEGDVGLEAVDQISETSRRIRPEIRPYQRIADDS